MRHHLQKLSVCALLAAAPLACNSPAPEPPAQEAPAVQADAGQVQQARVHKRLSGARRPPLAAPNKPLDRPRTRLELRTTEYKLFLANLEGQLEQSRRLHERSPESPQALQLYAGHLLSFSKMMGDLKGIDQAARLASQGLKAEPEHLKLRLLRAQAHFALHRWEAARRDLEVVRRQQPQHPALASMEAEFVWNSGDVEGAQSMIEARAEAEPSWESLARLGGLKMALGDVEGADAAFARAETLYKDTAPVPVAWLYVQRGLLRLHSGRFPEAKVFYQAAVERAEGYPMAVEHLAEIEHLLGQPEEAIRLYQEVIQATDNPEFHNALAGVYQELGRQDEARASRDRARARNLALIQDFPEAMAGHGADFFLEEGEDHALALKLLKLNARDRPNPDAFQALAEAWLAQGDKKQARAAIDKALRSPVRRAEIFWTAARVAKAEGADPKEVEALRQQALALNPKIAVLEGEL